MTAMMDLGRMQDVPRPEEILLAQVDTYEIFQSSPLPVEIHRFEPPSGRRPMLTLTYHLPPASGESETALVARLTPQMDDARPRVASENAFRVESTPDGRVAEVRFRVEPGEWDLLALAVDPDSNTSAAFRETIQIREPSTGLHTSDPVFAAKIEPLPYATMATYDAPFTLGAFRVQSRRGNELPRGEPIQVFLEAYGGTGPYRAEFLLEGREEDGQWIALGQPSSNEEPLGTFAWSLPTSDAWPLGGYRVVVRIADSLGTTVEREIDFRLVPR